MLFVLSILLIGFVTVPASVIFEDCALFYSNEVPTKYIEIKSPGSAYELLAVDIEGCSMKLPCYVTLADDIPVSIEFYADFASRQLDQNVVININLVNLNTEVTPDQCEIEECPVRTNMMTSFTSVITVPSKIALNQRGYLRWRVYNESGKLVLCFSVLVQTQSPLQKLLRQALAEAATAPKDDLDEIADSIDENHDQNHQNITEGYLKDIINKYYANRNKQTENNGSEIK